VKVTTIFFTTLLLAACAGTPESKPADPAKPIPPVATANSATKPTNKDGPITSEKILAMQKEGYTIANQNGETYFCRKEVKTGSRVARETVCLTEKEIDDLREQTQRGLGNMMRQQPPPQGK
jgi:hypothetical protein